MVLINAVKEKYNAALAECEQWRAQQGPPPRSEETKERQRPQALAGSQLQESAKSQSHVPFSNDERHDTPVEPLPKARNFGSIQETRPAASSQSQARDAQEPEQQNAEQTSAAELIDPEVAVKEIEREIQERVEVALKQLREEKQPKIDEQQRQINDLRQRRDELRERKAQMEALLKEPVVVHPGEERDFVREQRSRLAELHEQVEKEKLRRK